LVRIAWHLIFRFKLFMHRILRTTIFSALIVISFFIVVQKVEAAVLTVMPNYDDINYGETFVVELRINSEKQVINAVKAVLTYSPSMLDVIDVSRGGSFLTLWPEEPTVDSTEGTISLTGGIPHGSYVVDGKIMSVTFRAISSGSVEIGIDQASTSVHLNDGQGTKTKLDYMTGIYQINPAILINIISPTHPNENEWYSNNFPIFQWELKKGATYSYTLSSDPDEIADNRAESTEGEVSYINLADGVYYFILNEKLSEEKWAIAGKRRVMIDTEAPVDFKLQIGQDIAVYNNQNFLVFLTLDVMSGIDHYDVTEGGKIYKNEKSPYLIKDQLLEKYITVVAYDKAGNKTESSIGNAPKFFKKLNYLQLFIVILAIVLLVIILFIVLRKKDDRQE